MTWNKLLEPEYLFLWVILAFAALVRFWGLDFGLPNLLCRPDEIAIVSIATSPLNCFHPGSFNYPSLFKYIVLAVYAVYFIIGLICRRFTSPADFIYEYLSAADNFYLLDRMVSVLLGVMTVYAVYKLAGLFLPKNCAQVSGLYLAFAYLHVRDSHFGVTDIPQTFFLTCALYFIVRSYISASNKDYLLAGIFSGLALGTKYAGIFMFIPILVAHYLTLKRYPGDIRKATFAFGLIYFFLAMAGAFLITSPYVLLDFAQFKCDFIKQSRYFHNGINGLILPAGWWYHLRYSLFYGLGWPLLLASITGIPLLYRKYRRVSLILFSFPVFFYFWISNGNFLFVRYIIPVIPFLCISAAFFTWLAVEKVFAKARPHLQRTLIIAFAFLILLPSIKNIIYCDYLLARKDNRLKAAEWFLANIPSASSVYQTGHEAGHLQLNFASGLSKTQSLTTGLNQRAAKLALVKARIQKNRRRPFNDKVYNGCTYRQDTGQFCCFGELTGETPDYIVVQISPLKIYSAIAAQVGTLLRTGYRPLKYFPASAFRRAENWYDQCDAFYLPFSGFEGIDRPGPNIYIYQRNDLTALPND